MPCPRHTVLGTKFIANDSIFNQIAVDNIRLTNIQYFVIVFNVYFIASMSLSTTCIFIHNKIDSHYFPLVDSTTPYHLHLNCSVSYHQLDWIVS